MGSRSDDREIRKIRAHSHRSPRDRRLAPAIKRHARARVRSQCTRPVRLGHRRWSRGGCLAARSSELAQRILHWVPFRLLLGVHGVNAPLPAMLGRNPVPHRHRLRPLRAPLLRTGDWASSAQPHSPHKLPARVRALSTCGACPLRAQRTGSGPQSAPLARQVRVRENWPAMQHAESRPAGRRAAYGEGGRGAGRRRQSARCTTEASVPVALRCFQA